MGESEDIGTTDSLVASGDGGTAATVGYVYRLSLPPPKWEGWSSAGEGEIEHFYI
jgi:hypothetical protein